MNKLPMITVSVVNYFGRETIKPECEVSKKFCRLLKQSTLTREDIEVIKELGYLIERKEVVL